MLERTQIFVDTSYLLASFYNSWEIGARAQLEIDLPEVVATLGQMVQQHLHQPVHRQFWYDGIPDSGPHRYQRALRTCDGVQLRAGQLIEWGDRRTQKAVDTRLVADLVLAGVRRDTTDIVLVSGDADMIPGVQEAVNHGVRVHLYGFGWDSMSSALRHACDSTTILDPREDFADCMQLEVLEGPLPPNIPSNGEGEASDETAQQSDDTTVEVQDADTTGQKSDADSATEQEVAEGVLVQPEEAPVAEEPEPQRTAGDREAAPVENRSGAASVQVVEKVIHEEETRTTSQQETSEAKDSKPTSASSGSGSQVTVTSRVQESVEVTVTKPAAPSPADMQRQAPNPSMMAPRRKLRSRYVPLPNEVWASAGYQSPFDVGQQYAIWWYENAATSEQRDSAHLLSGGGLPPEIDRPLLQFACETLHEYTLTESQRVALRDGFHSGIRGVLVNNQRGQ